MRRNDVVRQKNSDSWFYGRVVRKIDADTVLWICCGLHLHATKIDDLIVENDYKGHAEWTSGYPVKRFYNRGEDGWTDFESVKFERPPLFIRMPSLRKLKQRASRYHGRYVWKTPLDYEFIGD